MGISWMKKADKTKKPGHFILKVNVYNWTMNKTNNEVLCKKMY